MVSSSPYGSETMQAEALLREVDLPNYISDVHDLLRGAILGAPLPKRELEKVAQVIINRAIEDWGNRAAYSVVAARILAFISEREEAKAREIRKAWGEPDPPFALRCTSDFRTSSVVCTYVSLSVSAFAYVHVDFNPHLFVQEILKGT